MTMLCARIADCPLTEEYFAVTRKVEHLCAGSQPAVLLAEAAASAVCGLCAKATKRLLGNGHCARPTKLDCRYETPRESRTMSSTVENRSTLDQR